MLFQGWPKSRLAQIDYSNIQPGLDVCERYWRLKKINILKGLVGREINAALPSSKETWLALGNENEEAEYDDRPQIERRLSKLTPQLRTLIGEAILRLPTVLSTSTRRWIDSFEPDLIYSNLGMGSMARLVVKISQMRNIPIMPHFFDDWVTTIYKDQFLGSVLRRSMFHWFDACLQRAPIRLTISDAMSQEYRKRYGGRFETFMNAVELSPTQAIGQRQPARDMVRFLFIGSLAPDRWRPLRQIGEALWDLRSQGVDGELLIYTFPAHIKMYHSELTLLPVMRIMGTASPEEVPQLQRNADVLVHAESFDAHTRQYTKFSLSTKIPQYMMAGSCILAYGPGEVGSLRYLSENDTGLVVGKEDAHALRTAIARLITDAKLRQRLSENALAIAKERHEAEKQRPRFYKLAVHACQSWTSDNDKMAQR